MRASDISLFECLRFWLCETFSWENFISSYDGFIVGFGLRFTAVTSSSSANHILFSTDVIPSTTKISNFKVVKPLVTLHHLVIILKFASSLYFKRRLQRNKSIRNFGCGRLNEINEAELDFIEQVYMHLNGHGGGHGTSRSLRVMYNV